MSLEQNALSSADSGHSTSGNCCCHRAQGTMRTQRDIENNRNSKNKGNKNGIDNEMRNNKRPMAWPSPRSTSWFSTKGTDRLHRAPTATTKTKRTSHSRGMHYGQAARCAAINRGHTAPYPPQERCKTPPRRYYLILPFLTTSFGSETSPTAPLSDHHSTNTAIDVGKAAKNTESSAPVFQKP